MHTKPQSPWKPALQAGLIGGAVGVYFCLVGMVEAFSQRAIVSGWFTMGQVLLLAPIFLLTYSMFRRITPRPATIIVLSGLLSGILGGALLALLLLIGETINLRVMFANASPELYEILSFGLGIPGGLFALLLAGLVIGGLAAGFFLLPHRLRSAVLMAIVLVILIGLLRDLIMTVINQWVSKAKTFPTWAEWAKPIIQFIYILFNKQIFAASGLRPVSAIVLFLMFGVIKYWRAREAKPFVPSRAPLTRQQKTKRILTFGGIGLIFILAPPVLGIFFAEILDNVGLFILMGLGLNIVVGFAGLLDLGYVAFYAIGAYTMGVLTSPELGFFHLTFWQALPFALLTTFLAGVILGLPVLRMRGDYLAIVTLGFGEIVRILALSDWLRTWLGGTQGMMFGNLVWNQFGFAFNWPLGSALGFILFGIAVVILALTSRFGSTEGGFLSE